MRQLFAIASKMYRVIRPVRSRKYLAFVRTWPCIGCGSVKHSRDAMHVGPHGIATKASDLDTVPGCRVCHQELHRLGPVRFQLLHDLDFREAIEALQKYYVILHGELPGDEGRQERRAA